MSNYLKLFNNHSEYTAFTQTEEFIKPNVSHCVQENEIHYNPILPMWGAVDLGLPSGTLWASMNVGAASETDYGLYFQWGDISGYTAEDVTGASPTKSFSWSDYKFGEESPFSKYDTDSKTTLEMVDDAAYQASNGKYRMPTKAELEELTANTASSWDSERSGYTFTAPNGNSIFFPSAGICGDGAVFIVGSNGYYWLSSLNVDGTYYAWALGTSNSGVSIDVDSRYYGGTVRGVLVQ